MAKVAGVAAWSCVFFLAAACTWGADQGRALLPAPAAVEPQAATASQPEKHTDDDANSRKHRHRRSFRHHHDHVPHTTVVLPSGFVPLAFGGEVYYYSQGLFYQLINEDLLPAPAPVGIEVPVIPTLRERVEVGGQYYSLVQGVYYQMTAQGRYRVVAPPGRETAPD